MNDNKTSQKGFTIVELLVTIAVLGILSMVTFFAVRPLDRIREAQETRAIKALESLAKAVQQYNVDNGGVYPDEFAGVPTEIEPYIGNISQLDQGPWDGSYYDYDNYIGQDCVDDNVETTVQVSIRNVPRHNPDGSSNWTLYYVIEGQGSPRCSGPHWNLGECVNCANQ